MSFYSQFALAYEAVFPFSPVVYAFLRQHLRPAPAAILDVGCAVGHYAGRLVRDGFQVTALDLDPEMISVARERYPRLDLHVMDMLRIGALGRRFDGVVCIGNTAAHLPQASFINFVASVCDSLVTGGTFILQVMNWDYVLGQAQVTFPVIQAPRELAFLRWYRDVSPESVTFATRLTQGDDVVFEDAVPLYPMRAHELVSCCRKVGLQLVEHVGSYGGASFDPEAFSASIFVFRRGSAPG